MLYDQGLPFIPNSNSEAASIPKRISVVVAFVVDGSKKVGAFFPVSKFFFGAQAIAQQKKPRSVTEAFIL